MIFKLKSESPDGFSLRKLLDFVYRLSAEKKIQILNVVHDEEKLFLSFTFAEWAKLAPQKYLDTKTFKSSLPIVNQELEKLESQVKKQVLEAAESELIASQLKVELNGTPNMLIFTSEYVQFLEAKQAKQIGLYLFDYLETTFKHLDKNQSFNYKISYNKS